MGSAPETVTLPGDIHGVAAPGPDGPLVVTTYDGDNLSGTVLTALTPAGKVLWQRRFDGCPSPPRVSVDGTVRIAHRGAEGDALTELDLTGTVLRSIVPEHEPHEHLAAFVLLPEGSCAAWLPAEQWHKVPPGRAPSVARYDGNGRTVWSTTLELGAGAIEESADTGRKPWPPRTFTVPRGQPLLVSADRVAALYEDYGSGIGVTFFLDANDGELIARTPPGPHGYSAVVAPGEFLIGEQGYGIARTTRYDRSGMPVRRWASHGLLLVDRHAAIRGPEYENILPSRSRFRGLAGDGSLIDGPALSGVHTTYPALDHNGTAVFWRDGRLLAVDADFRVRELFAGPDEDTSMGRVLLLARGQVVFAYRDTLLIFRDTGLGPLDEGVWPCGDGNLNGNPVCCR